MSTQEVLLEERTSLSPGLRGGSVLSIGTAHVELEAGLTLQFSPSLVPLISFKHTSANNYWNPNSLGENTELDPFHLAKYMI